MSELYLQYGSYSHPLSEAAVSIRRVGEFNDAGVAYANREQWTIQGRLHGDSQSAITTAIRNLEVAYNYQNRDIFLKFDGGTKTAHGIRLKDTIDGIRVSAAPTYPTGYGAEYANYRTYTITVEALVRTNQGGSEIVYFDETISTSGGRPRQVIVETLNTLPVIQQVANATAYIVSQAGRAVGLDAWPPPAPYVIFGGAVVLLNNRVTRRSPRETVTGGATYKNFFETTWSYQMATPMQLNVMQNNQLPHYRAAVGG